MFLFLGDPANERQGEILVEAARVAIASGYVVAVDYQYTMAQWYLVNAEIPFQYTYDRHQVKGGIIFGLKLTRWFWLGRLGYLD